MRIAQFVLHCTTGRSVMASGCMMLKMVQRRPTAKCSTVQEGIECEVLVRNEDECFKALEGNVKPVSRKRKNAVNKVCTRKNVVPGICIPFETLMFPQFQDV
eukprot:gene5175-15382_t